MFSFIARLLSKKFIGYALAGVIGIGVFGAYSLWVYNQGRDAERGAQAEAIAKYQKKLNAAQNRLQALSEERQVETREDIDAINEAAGDCLDTTIPNRVLERLHN